MKGITWGVSTPKSSSHSRPISWIVVSVGVLAVFFLTFASWAIVSYSYPIGSTVHGYFNGVEIESSQNSDLSVSSINGTSADRQVNASLDLVDNKAPLDLKPSIVSNEVSSDSKIEHTDIESNSKVSFGESASPKLPVTIKEVNGLETSEAAAASSSQGPAVTSLEKGREVVNSSLPGHSNSQIDLASTSPIPVAGTNSSIVKGNIIIILFRIFYNHYNINFYFLLGFSLLCSLLEMQWSHNVSRSSFILSLLLCYAFF